MFSEPLVATGRAPTADENRQIAKALQQHLVRAVPDDFSSLEKFIAANPASPWTPSLQVNLGTEYYNTGWYSKTLATWEQAWLKLKSATNLAEVVIADRAAGELAYMYARIGRMVELNLLLESITNRPLHGPATERIAGAKQGLWTMQNKPEIGFRCGPMALDRILASQDAHKAYSPLILASKSTTNGTSLCQVADLSRQLGMNYQMAYREKGAPIIMPSVVHWKVGHYAAVIREENGLYLLQDPTFGNDTWVSRRVLEAEASGYFLIPPGGLAQGWKAVTTAEGGRVWGKGYTDDSDPDATTCEDLYANQCSGCIGMAVNNAHLMVVSLNIQDSPVGYTPPVGPSMRIVATYNQREAGQPSTFNYSNLGAKWTFNWLAYIKDNPTAPSADVKFYPENGGALPFSGYNASTRQFVNQIKSQALLTRTSSDSYEMLMPDGSKRIFALPDSIGGTSRRVFLTAHIDPQGNEVKIIYDATFRIIALRDAIGQVTTFSYRYPSDPFKITMVTDPFGRRALFDYDATGRLSKITDSINLPSEFTYNAGNFIQTMTTPYGMTQFAYGESGRTRWLETTYPNSEKERVEYSETSGRGIQSVEAAWTVPQLMAAQNQWLENRATYFWNRRSYPSYAASPNDYTTAHRYHWLHLNGNALSSGILESEKPPLQNRIWYNYPNQTWVAGVGSSDKPTVLGRALDDGSTQRQQYQYNALGRLTSSTDPAGRTATYFYSSDSVDLLQVYQQGLVASFTYNDNHRPLTITDAAGKTTVNTYNSKGQLLSTTSPKGEAHAFDYSTDGYLNWIDGPASGDADKTQFTYDSAGRVRTVTGLDGYTLTYDYDNLDRLKKITYPDSTFEELTYDKLDRVKSRDRMGRETIYTYDSLRQLKSVEDPLHRVTRFEYCGCGSLSTLIDPMNRTTSWEHDIQGRLTAKQYVDGSRITYNYEPASGRLKSIIDEKGQFKVFDYNLDGNIKRISYPNALVPTPSVNFTYDTGINRLLTMQDGIGTTTWTYKPVNAQGALQVASVTGPWPNQVVTYDYDELGRTTTRAINGVPQTYAFDALSRITNVVNALGSFGYGYDGFTARLLDVAYPNNQTSHYDYFDNTGDRRLQSISHRKPDTSLISRFTYAYNPVGNITNWVQEMGALTETWTIGYDEADQLLSVLANQGNTNTIAYNYAYDKAGNRKSERINSLTNSFEYNSLNQIANSSTGQVNTITYEWDAEQRLTAINAGTNRSEFSYDGMGRRVRIVEKTNGVVASEKRFLWCGTEICQERSASDVLTKQFFGQGVTTPSGNFFYSRDHLGSIRELSDASVVIRARYAYQPFGFAARVDGDLESDFTFTGHYRHPVSGLYLTLHRAFEARTGRWLSKDPIGEKGGNNLYIYVRNQPTKLTDRLGLYPLSADEIDHIVRDANTTAEKQVADNLSMGDKINMQHLKDQNYDYEHMDADPVQQYVKKFMEYLFPSLRSPEWCVWSPDNEVQSHVVPDEGDGGFSSNGPWQGWNPPTYEPPQLIPTPSPTVPPRPVPIPQ